MKEKPISILQDIEDDEDFVVGKKYNGFSEVLVVKDSTIRLFNRSGTEQTDNVPHLTKIIVPKSLDLVLTGEGYARSGRLEDAKSIFGSYSGHALKVQESSGLGCFAAVNITRLNGESLTHIPFGERLVVLKEAIQRIKSYGAINLSQEELQYHNKKDYFNHIVANGGEGVVVKKLSGLEDDWFKIKVHHTWDVIIVGFTMANYGKTGKFASLIGAVRYGVYDDGKLIELGKCSGMTDNQRIDFTARQEFYIGKVMEIKGQELGNHGAVVFPRFVRIQEDKLSIDCQMESYKNY